MFGPLFFSRFVTRSTEFRALFEASARAAAQAPHYAAAAEPFTASAAAAAPPEGLPYLIALLAPAASREDAQALLEAKLADPQVNALLQPLLPESKSLRELLAADGRFAWVIAPLLVLAMRKLAPYDAELLRLPERDPREALKASVAALWRGLRVRALAFPYASLDSWLVLLEQAQLTDVALRNVLRGRVRAAPIVIDQSPTSRLVAMLEEHALDSAAKRDLVAVLSAGLRARGLPGPFDWEALGAAFDPQAAPQPLRAAALSQAQPVFAWAPLLAECGIDSPAFLASLERQSMQPDLVAHLNDTQADRLFGDLPIGQQVRFRQRCAAYHH